MDVRVKLAILADAAKYDASCASSGSRRGGNGRGVGSTEKIGICHSYTPDGRCVSLLKILLTNYCIYDCQYCVNRITSDTPRARFAVGEVVALTLEFYKRNYIEGLFLSSGVIQSVDYTMEQLIEVARRLREDEHYNGYIHLKAVPGASEELTARAGRYADRLSANIELPTEADLGQLAPEKTHAEIERTMGHMRVRIAQARAERRESAKAPAYAPAGQSTQMIVGATPSTDSAILGTAARLYERQNLRRVYYSAYSPIPHGDDRLPPAPPPLVREHRLYQADWLLRFYGFDARELTTPDEPNLDLHLDPKLAWALRHRDVFPVDLNRAPKWKLLRVPGIGVRNVARILKLRRLHRIRTEDLAKLRVSVQKAKPFVITEDHNPDALRLDRDDLRERVAPRHRQLNLFDLAASAAGGEV
ncbi:MAG: Biotin synthase related domain containing protein [uncultured Phycisphaerae bacterium]|uniref:Biotin synthase related domain containing protein n=1 Tax=uncultured Phycisphaerae bacterium TaxID=904963 RepID=A0A6J4NS80_9BACT|nr:MAG: Biotin synthase related domain containing protein [uncultured Phycisphaerae bacterium]